MKIGLIGAPSSGKTTVFNALTGHQAPVGGRGGKLNLAVVKVPDVRVDRLSAICKPKKTTWAQLTFADFPGQTNLRSLDAEVATLIRDFDALALVLGAFASDPRKDLLAVEAELLLADLGLIEKRLERLAKEKPRPEEKAALTRLHTHLLSDRPLRTAGVTDDERKILSGFSLLSLKPMLYVVNVAEADAVKPVPPAVAQEAIVRGAAHVVLSGSVEAEIATLAPEEQGPFLAELGLEEPAIGRFIRAAYALCDLISFFTVGPDEVRAWTVRRGSSARTAAGKIHTDLERGFIRAEIISLADFFELQSEARCREVGKLRTEGKDYVVEDGDILHVRFNV